MKYTITIQDQPVEIEVDDLPLPPSDSPEEAARLQNQMQGIGDARAQAIADDAVLAFEVNRMNHAEFARYRAQHGIGGLDTFQALSGSK